MVKPSVTEQREHALGIVRLADTSVAVGPGTETVVLIATVPAPLEVNPRTPVTLALVVPDEPPLIVRAVPRSVPRVFGAAVTNIVAVLENRPVCTITGLLAEVLGFTIVTQVVPSDVLVAEHGPSGAPLCPFRNKIPTPAVVVVPAV